MLRQPQFTPRCWMKAGIIARSAPCTGYWQTWGRRASAGTSSSIRLIRSRSCWPPVPTSSGVGTLRNCWGRQSGYYLYVILDVFSRYVVGWMVADGESAQLAQRLIADSCGKQAIQPGQLTIHADRGSSMTSKPVAFLMADLGITKTHSRPHVSDDNPYSESHFRTLKYRPGFPPRFGSLQDARAFAQDFFAWYNQEHRHCGLGLLSPAVVHHGLAPAAIERRRKVLDTAYRAHPERFVRRPPQPLPAPQEVWINKPQPPVNKPQ